MTSKRVTIFDVAEKAGVSYQTVSRVINNRPDVSEETRTLVQKVIRQLGYRPSAAARSLVSQRTHTLGLITADFSDYFFTQVIIGAETEARRQGYFFMLGSTERNPQDEPEYFRLLTEQRVEGILFARPSTELEQSNQSINALLRQNIPLVTTAYHDSGNKFTVVDVDNVSGGFQATQCLTDAQHRAVAMITGIPGWRSVNDRSEGYRWALEKAGIDYDPSLVDYGDWSYESGYAAMQRLLDKAPHITALFAQNDRMAIGAISALRQMGRNVPDDVAVIGYDDIPVAAYYHPRLTTIQQPMQEVGQTAAQLLIEAINNPAADKQEVLLKPTLIRRDSCA